MNLSEGCIYIGAFKMGVKQSVCSCLRNRLQKKGRSGQRSKLFTQNSVFLVPQHLFRIMLLLPRHKYSILKYDAK